MSKREEFSRIVGENVRLSKKVSSVRWSPDLYAGTFTFLRPLHSFFCLIFPGIQIQIFDASALEKIQLNMMQQVCGLYLVNYVEAKAKDILFALTGDTIARYVKAVFKSIPGMDWLTGEEPIEILAGASTYALAQTMRTHFEFGGDLFNIDLDIVKRVYQKEFPQGKKFAAGETSTIDLETARSVYHHERLKKEKREGSKVKAEPASSNASSGDVFEKLEKLAQLKEKGIITEEEFNTYKKKLLDQL